MKYQSRLPALRMFSFRIPRRLKVLIRRSIGDPAVLLEEYPNCPGLFHYYRDLLTTGHKRQAGGWEWEGKFYPDHLTIGGACFGAFRAAKRWCSGEGIDIGAGAWPLPGSRPIDPSWYPQGLRLEDVLPGSQDYVFSSHTLEHIKSWHGALAEFVSKIKPGGILFLYLPHPDCGLWRMENPFMRQHHKWVPEPVVVKNALTSFGMQIEDQDDGPDVMMSFFVCARNPVRCKGATLD